MMALKDDFESAVKRVNSLSERPTNDELLALYSLYKQATEGDVKGNRPGMLDLKGRAKFDAWTKRKGMSAESAMQEYMGLATKLGS